MAATSSIRLAVHCATSFTLVRRRWPWVTGRQHRGRERITAPALTLKKYFKERLEPTVGQVTESLRVPCVAPGLRPFLQSACDLEAGRAVHLCCPAGAGRDEAAFLSARYGQGRHR
jgi:hypothetical protein